MCFPGEAHEVVNVKTEAGEEVVSEERGPHLPFALCCEREIMSEIMFSSPKQEQGKEIKMKVFVFFPPGYIKHICVCTNK